MGSIMSKQLYRVGDTEWWILVDTEKKSILEQFHKPQVEADINAIKETLDSRPDLTEQEQDLKDIMGLIDATSITQTRKDRAKQMLRDMWEAYQDSSEVTETIELANRLERLEGILDNMK